VRLGIIFLAVTMCFAISSICLAATYCNTKTRETERPSVARVLFLVGGYEGHDSDKLPKMLAKVLEDTGKFKVRISQDRDLLKPENIAHYDIVLSYTTRGRLTPEQEKGLTEFVAGGKGFVGIHSATDSFRDSDAYWKMVGGRFAGHGHGMFKVKITGKSHPIVKDLEDFEITDETYVHVFHPESKLIVLTRRGTDGEPSAWVQYYDKGRVFVTGLGHGASAWENPAFQKLITRAMNWAAGWLNP
jgi:type 1 glutamine amidotransferase